MKKVKHHIRTVFAGKMLLAGLLLAAGSCNKDPDADFVSRDFAVDAFHTILVEGVYEIYLVQDTVCSVTMTAPPRIFDKTTVSVSDGVLTLHEKHGGHWLHPRESNTKVYIHVDSLARINVEETCNIRTAGRLGHTTDEIGLVVNHAKMMEADLELDCGTFYYWNDPSGTHINLRGRADNLKLWNTGLSTVDASKLTAGYALIDNGSQGAIHVRSLQTLEYKLTNTGNIYYYGSPVQVNALGNTGTGQLIKAD